MERVPEVNIQFLERNNDNNIYILRDDLIPYSFGGNKVRKALLFFEEIDAGGYDTVITYGSGGSNHCRVVANMAAGRGLLCHIISSDQDSPSINRKLVTDFGSVVHSCPVEQVAATIDATLAQLTRQGRKPYFIPGGGHGDVGTRAYDLCYDRIQDYSDRTGIPFDYIFLASGTGATHAGLICGQLRHGSTHQKIVGISIARRNPRGGQVVADSVRSYTNRDVGDALIFDDRYICGGYGCYNEAIENTIRRLFTQKGLPLDPTYTGKAYTGMEAYLADHAISGKNVLFIHTGGTPLFCDWVKK